MAEKSPPSAITAVSVKGFKSFVEEQRIEIRPLTLLAGANSSGKSSALQPLLLLKQTLEAAYDPGPLLLDGPHIRFTSAEQMLSRVNGSRSDDFQILIEDDKGFSVRNVFKKVSDGVALDQSVMIIPGGEIVLAPGVSSESLEKSLKSLFGWESPVSPSVLKVRRSRCFFKVFASFGSFASYPDVGPQTFEKPLLSCLHVPRARGNPERSYNTSAVEDLFPGTFENYVASVIAAWQKASDERLDLLEQALQALGLTWKVEANPLDATRVELLVARLPQQKKSARRDLVNIADVGFGVSQVLPVLVALLTAEPGQLVYIEQPELHLHPQAEQALAPILAEAANRGVRVVVETHSAILLIAIQALVAEDKLSPEILKLHWFQRDSRGATRVTSGDLDQNGAYGDWPVDFYSVERDVTDRYLDAVETKFFSKKKNA